MPEREVTIAGVRAVLLFVDDPRASSRWWADVLSVEGHVDDAYCWLEFGGVEIGFHPADQIKNPRGASTVAYLSVASVSAAVDRLRRAGAHLHRGPLVVDSVRSIAQISDPFGAVMGLDGPP